MICLFVCLFVCLYTYVWQLYVATSPALAGVTGQFFNPVGVHTSPSSLASDTELQQRLWKVSADMTARFMQSQTQEGNTEQH